MNNAKELFENKQDGRNKGRVAYVERRDDVAKTVVLIYVDGNGGTKVSYSTLKRWWKKVDNTETTETQEAPVQDDDKCGDGTPYTEVFKQIVKGAERRSKEAKAVKEAAKANTDKPKTKKAHKTSNTNPDAEPLLNFVLDTVTSMGQEIFIPQNGMKMRTFKTGGHMFAKFNFSSRGVTLACRSAAVDIPCDKKLNHLFDNLYVFTTLDKDSKSKIKTLLQQACKQQQAKNENKNSKNTKKEDK